MPTNIENSMESGKFMTEEENIPLRLAKAIFEWDFKGEIAWDELSDEQKNYYQGAGYALIPTVHEEIAEALARVMEEIDAAYSMAANNRDQALAYENAYQLVEAEYEGVFHG